MRMPMIAVERFKLLNVTICLGAVYISILGLLHSAEQPKQILDTQVYDLGDRSITYSQINPTVLKESPAPALSSEEAIQPAPTPLPPEIRQRAEKIFFMPFMEIRVVGNVTEIQWRDDDGEYVVWSNIDGNHFRVLSAVETDHSYFTFFGAIYNETVEEVRQWNAEIDQWGGPQDMKKSIPLPLPAKARGSEYRFVTSPATGVSPRARMFMDDLHAYYDTNKATIAGTYNQKEAEGWTVPKVDRSAIPKNRQIYSITDPSEITRIRGGERQ